MGHHINEEGRFQSDKHPNLRPDKVIVDLTDPDAWLGLLVVARGYRERDREFADDLERRVRSLMGWSSCRGEEHSK